MNYRLFVAMIAAWTLTNHCYGQIATYAPPYEGVSKIKQEVKLGKFGCGYKILHSIGADQRIEQSTIKIPRKQNLLVEYTYNEHGDIVLEKVSSRSGQVAIQYQYRYDTIQPAHNDQTYLLARGSSLVARLPQPLAVYHNNLNSYHIKTQITTIDSSSPVVIQSLLGGNTHQQLNLQLKTLQRRKDKAILKLLGQYPKTEQYALATCNCVRSRQSKLIDEVYDYELSQLKDKNGMSLGPGRRNGTKYYIGYTKHQPWRLEETWFTYDFSQYLIEKYKYIN